MVRHRDGIKTGQAIGGSSPLCDGYAGTQRTVSISYACLSILIQ